MNDDTPQQSLPTSFFSQIGRRIWLGLAVVLFVVFTGLRFYELGVRPMHNDEGVNAWFMMNLIRDNNYKYNPENYHGPSLYYLQLVPTWINGFIKEGWSDFSFKSLSGMTDRSIRTPVALASLLLLLGLLMSGHRVGRWGALTAFVLAGLSCDMIYFSRYFIHEMYFVLFTFGIYWGATKYRDTGKEIFFYLFILSATLLFCTKETSVVTYFVMGFSVVCVEILHRFLPRATKTSIKETFVRNFEWVWDGLFNKYWMALLAGVVIWFLLYTSFHPYPLKHWSGLADSIRTYFKWTREGMESGHVKPIYYWIKNVLLPYELALVVLSLLGSAAALIRNDKKGLYLFFWTIGTVSAYSVIPYKTIWCVINFLLPMALLSGYGVQAVIDHVRDHRPESQRFVLAVFAVALMGLAAVQVPKTLRVVYSEYDKEFHEQPYVHTSRDIFSLVKEIQRLAAASSDGNKIVVNIFSDVYWPLPFYFRDYPNVKFWGRYEGVTDLDAPLIVAAEAQEAHLGKLLTKKYFIQDYLIRSGYSVLLYANRRTFPSLPEVGSVPMEMRGVSFPPQTRPGLKKTVYPDRRCEGPFLRQEIEKSAIDFSWNKEKDKPVLSPFCLEWDGYLEVPQSGNYRFGLESDDGSSFYLNDRLVIDNGRLHARLKKETTLHLTSGLYKLKLNYFDVGGQAFLRLTWTPPGDKETVISPAVLSFEETSHDR